MKLNKKRVTILVSLMCLLILLVFTLCSFDLPSYDTPFSELPTFSGLTQSEVDYIFTILNMQAICGQFNSLVPVCLQFTNGKIYGIFTPFNSNFTMSFTSSLDFYYTSDTPFVRIGLSGDGFSIYQVYGTNVTLPRSNVFGYRSSLSSELVRFNGFTYASGANVSQDLIDILNYWNNFANRLVYGGVSSEELESAYNAGYETGVETGHIIGWDEGYETGYNSGYNYGLADGYETGYGAGAVDGFVDGYDVGYDTGYADGYDTGYDSGYSDAERETVIEYVEPFDIDIGRVISGISSVPDNIMNGSFDFELFGINVYGLLKLLIILFVVSAIVVFIIKRAS